MGIGDSASQADDTGNTTPRVFSKYSSNGAPLPTEASTLSSSSSLTQAPTPAFTQSSANTSATSSTAPIVPENGSNSNTNAQSTIPLPESKNINAGAIAGSLIGGLAVGALVAFLFAFFVIRRKYNSRLAAHKKQIQKDQIEQNADSYSDKDLTQTLIYASDPNKDNQIKDFQKRIKTLENERNAASAFGDKLDNKSEQELLSAPGFGLSLLNENINQLAMTISVKASGCGQLGTSFIPVENRSEQFSNLYSRGPSFVRDNFEDCVRHVINSTLYERIALPFCFEASEQGRSTGYSKIAREILRDNDQAMYARWRSMTHTTLRISAEKKAKQSQYSSLKQVQQSLTDIVIDLLLYAGMEPDKNAAIKTVNNVQSRIGEILKQCSKFMVVVREEMSSKDYAIEIIPSNSGKLTKSLGLSAKAKSDAISRILLQPVAA